MLWYNVYIADYSTTLQLKVEARLIESILRDTCTTSGGEAIMNEAAERLFVPITDHLVISPSRVVFAAMGDRRRVGSALFSSPRFGLKIRRKVNDSYR